MGSETRKHERKTTGNPACLYHDLSHLTVNYGVSRLTNSIIVSNHTLCVWCKNGFDAPFRVLRFVIESAFVTLGSSRLRGENETGDLPQSRQERQARIVPLGTKKVFVRRARCVFVVDKKSASGRARGQSFAFIPVHLRPQTPVGKYSAPPVPLVLKSDFVNCSRNSCFRAFVIKTCFRNATRRLRKTRNSQAITQTRTKHLWDHENTKTRKEDDRQSSVLASRSQLPYRVLWSLLLYEFQSP